MKKLIAKLFGSTEQRQAPDICLDDPQFGALRWNHQLFCWEGSAEFSGKPVSLMIETPEYEIPYSDEKRSSTYEPDRSITERTRAAYVALESFIEGAAIEGLAERNFELVCEWEASAGNESLRKDEFLARVSLSSISLHPDGGGELWFHDGGLFWGHSLNLVFDRNFKVLDSGIHG